MLPNTSASHPAATAGQSSRIVVVLVRRDSTRHFEATLRGETIPLESSHSLNRWTATGIVRRHEIARSSEGLSLDGRLIRFDDAHAAEELERILNEPQTMPHAPPTSHAHATAIPSPMPSAEIAAEFAKLVESLRVTRDGFEFHISYVSKFGEHKTERLESALQTFQGMRAFKPHINVQKAGIRLVVTLWDGDRFSEEGGIENIEHATPDEIQALLKQNMQGTSGTPSNPAAKRETSPPQRVTRLQLVRRPHESRFHVVLHRSDGTTTEGPLLIRANLHMVSGLFRPEICVLMTVLNDRLIIERVEKLENTPTKRAEVFDLKTEEDARKIETALNSYLKC